MISKQLEALEPMEQLRLARFFYKHGTNLLSDAEYDALVLKLKQSGCVVDPIYENDPVPVEDLRKFGVDDDTIGQLIDIESDNKSDIEWDLFSEASLLSISAVFDIKEAYEWFEERSGLEIVMSPKIDGINTRVAYRESNGGMRFAQSITRGGEGAMPFNISKNMRWVVPSVLKTFMSGHILFYAESVVESNQVKAINEKYGTDYVTPRGLALSMLRVNTFAKEDYVHLRTTVFRTDFGDTLSAGLDFAKNSGMRTVPYIILTYEHMSFESFKQYIENKMQSLQALADAEYLRTDGIVAEVNNRVEYSKFNVSNKYSAGTIALKFGLWKPGVYESKVVDVEIVHQSAQACCVAIVEPVLTDSGKTITRVNIFNPDIMIRNNIRAGELIRFEYKNETTVNLLYE